MIINQNQDGYRDTLSVPAEFRTSPSPILARILQTVSGESLSTSIMGERFPRSTAHHFEARIIKRMFTSIY
jgi:hypothetical protein